MTPEEWDALPDNLKRKVTQRHVEKGLAKKRRRARVKAARPSKRRNRS